MLYNKLFNLLAEVRDNPDLASLSARLSIPVQTLRRQLESLEEDVPTSLFTRLDSSRAVLSEAGLVYAEACRKIDRLVVEAELKGERLKREREGCIIVGALSRNIGGRIRSACSMKLTVRHFDVSSPEAPGALKHLGRDFDVALGMYDEAFLRKCSLKAVELSHGPLAVAVSASGRLAGRRRLDIEDLYGGRLYVPCHGFTRKTDVLAADLREFHPRISIEERDGLTGTFLSHLEEEGEFILVSSMQDLSAYGLKVLAVDWVYTVSYGLLYSSRPSQKVLSFIDDLERRA